MGEKIAVVTGASSGFGLLTSVELARKGFRVIATMRNIHKGSELMKEAKSAGVETKIMINELDVTNKESIERLISLITEMDRIDVLVNNAGFAVAGFGEEVSMEEYRRQFETNVFGVMAVTKAVLPLMRRQREGKIITLSSISGKVAFPGLSPYSASKHAIEGWSESLRLEMKPFGVHVVLVEPGSYKTNIWSSGKQVAAASVQSHSPYEEYMKKIENYLAEGESRFGDPRDVARKISEISIRKNPALRYPIGRGVKITLFMKNFLPWKLWEKILIKKLLS